MYCIVMYCILKYCIVLYCILMYCILFYFNVLYCIVLYFNVLFCILLYCIVWYKRIKRTKKRVGGTRRMEKYGWWRYMTDRLRCVCYYGIM